MEKLNIFLRKSFEPVLFFFPCPSVSILHLALVLLPDEFRFISFLFFSSGHLPSPIHVSGRTGVWYILDGGRGGGSSNRATRNPLASSFFFFPAVVFLRSRLHDWKQSTTKCALTHSAAMDISLRFSSDRFVPTLFYFCFVCRLFTGIGEKMNTDRCFHLFCSACNCFVHFFRNANTFLNCFYSIVWSNGSLPITTDPS